MHDITNLEGRGIPGVGVASTEFIPAAAAQAKSLGFDAPMVFVPHPIQRRRNAGIGRGGLCGDCQPGVANLVVDTAGRADMGSIPSIG
jgi:hypothetical protein